MLAVAGMCSPDPSTFGTLRLFDVADHQLLGTLPPTSDWQYVNVAFSPDGKTLLAAGALTTGTLETTGWNSTVGVIYVDPASQQVVASATTQFMSLENMAFSPDGRTGALAESSGDEPQQQAVQLFDVATRRVTATLVRQESNAVAFSPDGRLVAATEFPDAVQVWDVASHSSVRLLTSATHNAAVPFMSLTFSPDGRVIVVGDYNGGLTFWDVASGRLLNTLPCGYRASSLAYNRDGSVLAIGTGKGRVIFFSP